MLLLWNYFAGRRRGRKEGACVFEADPYLLPPSDLLSTGFDRYLCGKFFAQRRRVRKERRMIGMFMGFGEKLWGNFLTGVYFKK